MLFERCLHSPSLASVHRFKDDGDLQVTHTHMTGGFIARFKPTRFRPWSTATRGAAELLLMRNTDHPSSLCLRIQRTYEGFCTSLAGQLGIGLDAKLQEPGLLSEVPGAAPVPPPQDLTVCLMH